MTLKLTRKWAVVLKGDPMSCKNILLEQDDFRVRLIQNSPENLNFIDLEMQEELGHLLPSYLA